MKLKQAQKPGRKTRTPERTEQRCFRPWWML